MGEGVQVGKSSQGGITNENVILEHFLCKLLRSILHNNTDWLSVDDVTTNTINSFIACLRQLAFDSIFLLNSIFYLRRHLLLQPDHPDLGLLFLNPSSTPSTPSGTPLKQHISIWFLAIGTSHQRWSKGKKQETTGKGEIHKILWPTLRGCWATSVLWILFLQTKFPLLSLYW